MSAGNMRSHCAVRYEPRTGFSNKAEVNIHLCYREQQTADGYTRLVFSKDVRCISTLPVQDNTLFFHLPWTNSGSAGIQRRFKEITSCRDLVIFVNMRQKIEREERTSREIKCVVIKITGGKNPTTHEQQTHEAQKNDFKADSPPENNIMAWNYNSATCSQGHSAYQWPLETHCLPACTWTASKCIFENT